MKNKILGFLIFIPVLLNAQVNELKKASDRAHSLINPLRNVDPNLLSYVNPFIGTGGHGHTFPGATVPFGMVQLSPDTRMEGWDGCGGYHYSDSIIHGFSHTHLSGTGVPDYADLLVTPVCGNYPAVPSYLPSYLSKASYGSRFNHKNERATPGQYEVHLIDGNIDVSLTATQRTGIHKYTFKGKGKRYIVLDLDYRDKVLDAGFTINGNQEISGYRKSEGWAKLQYFYFALNTSIPFTKAEEITSEGKHRLVLHFDKKVTVIELRVGISAVDEEGARKNLLHETDGLGFEKLTTNAKNSWQIELSKIQVESNNLTQKTIFYTALYHTMMAPNIFSDVDGRYRGRDFQIHTIDQKVPQYTVFSLWDTYRATHPLFTIIDQKRTNAFIKTFLRQFNEGKDLPVWELAANETECMIGFHSASVIADAYVKGINNFPAEEALNAMVFTSNINEYGKTLFRDYGLISSDWESESVSKALEYAYDHWCIAQMARGLGKTEIAANHDRLGLNFINHFDPNSKFMRARRGAQWVYPFNPTEVNFNYTEANSWQYSLYAPQQPYLLTNLIGGKKALSAWLDQLFSTSSSLSGREQADITGLIGQYAHGNEPSHHMAYMYNYSATPWKTQVYVDSIQRSMYHNAPDGLSGNEDCGQMSAWYVLSALGFYPLAPGNTRYELGHPIFEKATIRLENGKSIEIKRNGLIGKYIRAVRLNGIEIKTLDHSQLMQGGILEFEMSSRPFQTYLNEDLYEISGLQNLIPVPFISTENRVFTDSLRIEMGMVNLNNGPQYTEYAIEENQVIGEWKTYTKPFTIHSSCKIHSRGTKDISGQKTHSATLTSVFQQKEKNCQLELKSTYEPAYAAAGPNTLIDKIKGSNDFRTGDWQGFQGKDVVAIVSFKDSRTINSLGASWLKDLNSWIFEPSQLIIETSNDGITYRPAAEFVIQTATKETEEKGLGSVVKSVVIENVKYIRYTIRNQGVCPNWHLGAGNPTWIFLDELIFD